MTYTKIDIHPLNLDKARQSFKRVAPAEEYESVISWIRELTIEKALSERRQLRLLGDMGLFFRIFRTPLNKITKEQLLEFKGNLLNNKIQKLNEEGYSDAVKEGLTETVSRYLEWKYFKKTITFTLGTKPFRRWFIIRSKNNKTPEILSESEIKKLYMEAKPLWQKYVIANLFGSGCRAEEFLNLRFEDYEAPTKNFPYYQIDVKEEYSKTLGRKVGLYFELCTEATARYLESIEKKDSKDRVLEMDYDAVRMFLTRLGEKVLNKRIHFHMFRKSSATYYASKLNRQQLCKRFGWKFSSDVVDIYINRAGVDEFEVKDVMLGDDISVLRKEQQEQKTIYETRINLQQRELDHQKAINNLITKRMLNQMSEVEFKKEIGTFATRRDETTKGHFGEDVLAARKEHNR